MLSMSDAMLEALAGSRAEDRIVADVYYDGQLVADDVPLSSWSLDADATRAVRQQFTAQAVSDDGALAPWGVDDPLGVGGSRLRLTYLMPQLDESVVLGEFRIVRASVSESWRLSRVVTRFTAEGVPLAETRARWSTSSRVELSADDLTKNVYLARFLGPERIGSPGSAFAEVRRLLDGILPVRFLAGVADGPVPGSLTYGQDRLAAVGELVGALGATYRMAPDGVLEVLPVPVADAPAVWTVAGGETGVLVDFGREFATEDFPNVAVVEGKGPDDRPLIGVARETTGALRAGGPHGTVPEFLSSDLMDSQTKVDAAAATRLASMIEHRTAVLPVTCLMHPGLQEGDVVTLSTPVGDLTGPVQTVRKSGSDGGMSPMELTLAVPWEKQQALAARLRLERGVS